MVTPSCYTSERHQHGGRKLIAARMLPRKLVDRCLKQCETRRSQAANLETQKQTKWMEMHQSQVNICFLRDPLR